MTTDQLTQLNTQVKELTALIDAAIKAKRAAAESDADSDFEPAHAKVWRRRHGIKSNDDLIMRGAFGFMFGECP